MRIPLYRKLCQDLSSPLLWIFSRFPPSNKKCTPLRSPLVPAILLAATILFYFELSNIVWRVPIGPWTNDFGRRNASIIVDDSLEGGSRILQASMLFGGHGDTVYERAMRTHVRHGERWGYRTSILRHDVVGKGEWKILVSSPAAGLKTTIKDK